MSLSEAINCTEKLFRFKGQVTSPAHADNSIIEINIFDRLQISLVSDLNVKSIYIYKLNAIYVEENITTCFHPRHFRKKHKREEKIVQRHYIEFSMNTCTSIINYTAKMICLIVFKTQSSSYEMENHKEML